MRNSFWLLISALCTAWLPAALGAPPARVEITYEVARNGMTLAEALYTLEHDGRQYQITETSKGRGLLALRGTTRRVSRGLISPEGLKPTHFIDERTGRTTARVDFDWQAKTVTQQYKGEPRTGALPAQAHDRLAFIFDFAFAPAGRREVAFELFDGRGQSRHAYASAGRERVKVPAGDFNALKVARSHNDERTEIWLAAELGYLPVRLLVLEKDGTRFEQVTTKISSQ